MLLHELNDLSLECIFKELSIRSQFSVLFVSTYFRNIIISMWRRQYRKEKKLSLPLQRYETIESYFKKHKEALAIFVPLICEYIEELTVTGAKVLNLMTAHKWPKLRHLEAHIEFDAETPNLQLIDEIFPALESLELSWCTNHVDYRLIDKIGKYMAQTRCERFTEECVDEDELAKSLTYEINLRRRRENRPRKFKNHAFLMRVKEYIRELVELRSKLEAVTAQKLNLFKSIKLKNLRKLKVHRFSAQSLCIDQMPQLQELHFENHRFPNPYYELTAFSKFIAYIASCINKQITEETRHQPLKVVCYYSDQAVCYHLHNTTQNDMLSINWVSAPFKDDYDLMPLYFAIQSDYRCLAIADIIDLCQTYHQ